MPPDKPNPGRVAIFAGAVLILTGGVILYRQSVDGGTLFGFGPRARPDASGQPVRVAVSAAPSAQTAPEQVAAPGPAPAQPEVRPRRVRFELSIYYPREPTREPLEALRSVHARAHRRLYLVPRVDAFSASPALAAEMTTPAEHPPPPHDVAGPLARGVRDQDLIRLGSGRALALTVQSELADASSALEQTYRLTEAVARETSGVICERETAECFSPEAFHDVRVQGWTDGWPQVDRQIAIRSSRSGEWTRTETRGMGKLGLPELVLEDYPGYLGHEVSLLLALAAQTMLERGRLDAPGRLSLDIAALRQPALKASMLEAAHGEAERHAELKLAEQSPAPSEDAQRTLSVVLPEVPQRAEALEALVSRLFGNVDRAARVEHDAELLAASQRARERLGRLAEQHRRGAVSGDKVQVKAPFLTATGRHEWMWVEVSGWHEDRVHGVLLNAPFEVPGIRAGAEVDVPLTAVFDYLRTLPDGVSEGNETSTILERREGRVTVDAGLKEGTR